ncbi:MAG: DNA-3-methyladenine glycosylase [candidate division KSB1 bacterium]|nr:DNA-3-methyladenine glycosylase [candidate division KSB1 bacterium]MDZ7367799.1 DNA-3-methyladenine glycosylase [candidate division KSB1 bacterium]MDZ7404873.1 DNA-3-methyladenine glycosylase [candidate division KSB1 bacterium]
MFDFSQGQLHLSQADPILATLISRYGQCTIQPQRQYFAALVEAILSQQLSVKAAATIFKRFKEKLGGRITPEKILRWTAPQFRAVGISRQKTSYLRDLAAKWQNGALAPRRFTGMTDEEVIAALTQVKGIGRWTAEMFLIFSLLRPDVLPVDDLGFRKAVQIAYKLRRLPDAKRLTQIAEPWRPYRSLATWYLWASLENKPIN